MNHAGDVAHELPQTFPRLCLRRDRREVGKAHIDVFGKPFGRQVGIALIRRLEKCRYPILLIDGFLRIYRSLIVAHMFLAFSIHLIGGFGSTVVPGSSA